MNEKKNEPVAEIAAPEQVAEQVAEGPTPENTPLPGGGSWRWDSSKPGYVDASAAAE